MTPFWMWFVWTDMYVYVCVRETGSKPGDKSTALLFVLTSLLAALINNPLQTYVQEQLCSMMMICVDAKKSW